MSGGGEGETKTTPFHHVSHRENELRQWPLFAVGNLFPGASHLGVFVEGRAKTPFLIRYNDVANNIPIRCAINDNVF